MGTGTFQKRELGTPHDIPCLELILFAVGSNREGISLQYLCYYEVLYSIIYTLILMLVLVTIIDRS